jgi:hypothetical protein
MKLKPIMTAVFCAVAPCSPVEDISEVLVRGLLTTVILEAANTSETSVNFYHTTRRNIPEDSHLHTRCHENLKCHLKPISISAYKIKFQ